ncbi:unnamed protein product, partial [Acanthoscelides obtectus]
IPGAAAGVGAVANEPAPCTRPPAPAELQGIAGRVVVHIATPKWTSSLWCEALFAVVPLVSRMTKVLHTKKNKPSESYLISTTSKHIFVLGISKQHLLYKQKYSTADKASKIWKTTTYIDRLGHGLLLTLQAAKKSTKCG